MTRMGVKAILVFIGLASSLQAAGQSLGAGVKLAEPTPLEAWGLRLET